MLEGFLQIAFAEEFDFEVARAYVANKIQNYTFYVTAVYIIAIFSIRAAMTNYKSFELKVPMALWNGYLAVFSVCGFYVTSERMISEIRQKGIIGSYAQPNKFFYGRSGYWAFMLMVSKTIELGDTFFLVFRKKPLIFLHWYHHVLTFNYAIWAYTEGQPFNMYIAWLNYGVHAVMYG
ncbi:unnamed protein product [Enterobius vermicularis]|uniref:Elongation of very long chain fatty acids protein n=1 Tax=Enterobius vermicularis TaxID=51028 RepID=A0A0N4VI35_ENTVE|nr:unnamed protein product [Enterobius vermicularis]